MLVALCGLLAGLAALGGGLILREKEPPVYDTGQALILGCSDAGAPGDACHPYRVAGNVVGNSVRWDSRFHAFEVTLTNTCSEWVVYFHGDAAVAHNLHAGDFVIAEGETSIGGEFHSGRLFVRPEAERLWQLHRAENVRGTEVSCLHERPARNAR